MWVPAAIVGIGGGGFEAGCAFFVDDRITEYADVLSVLQSFEAHADPDYFKLVEGAIPPFIELKDSDGNFQRYNIDALYIVDGMLKHRDYGPNTNIGRVVLLTGQATSG